MSHSLKILDASGHRTIDFAVGNKAQVDEATAAFNSQIKDGYLAYGDGKRQSTFDPNVKETVMFPPLVGG